LQNQNRKKINYVYQHVTCWIKTKRNFMLFLSLKESLVLISKLYKLSNHSFRTSLLFLISQIYTTIRKKRKWTNSKRFTLPQLLTI